MEQEIHNVEFDWKHILISSKFDSGNLANVEKVEKKKGSFEEFNLWTRNDCMDTEYQNKNRSWFYFMVKGAKKGETHVFNIYNMNCQKKLFKAGMKPVFKSRGKEWERVKGEVSFDYDRDDRDYFKLTFRHTYTSDSERDNKTYFAMCYPWSYKDLQKQLRHFQSLYDPESSSSNRKRRQIYFHRECLVESLQGRRVEVLTVSSRKGMSSEREKNLPNLYPESSEERSFIFPNKKVYFLSARVHPGETPASFIFNGFLKFILDESDPRAQLLRNHFVFKLVPIINPDGVSNGNYRTDTLGMNLNRCYKSPSFEEHPAIFGIKNLLVYLNENLNLFMYMDLHAHATKKGCFIFGNSLPRLEDQIENVLYSKLVSLNSQHVDFGAGNFSEKSMKSKDKRDGLSKDGTGRVGIYHHTNQVHCYTLEGNYSTGKMVNHLGDLPPAKSGCYAPELKPVKQSPRYTIEIYEDVGKGLATALLDIHLGSDNPFSRITNTNFHDINGVRQWVRKTILKKKKFWGGASKKEKKIWERNVDQQSSGSDSDEKPRPKVPKRKSSNIIENHRETRGFKAFHDMESERSDEDDAIDTEDKKPKKLPPNGPRLIHITEHSPVNKNRQKENIKINPNRRASASSLVSARKAMKTPRYQSQRSFERLLRPPKKPIATQFTFNTNLIKFDPDYINEVRNQLKSASGIRSRVCSPKLHEMKKHRKIVSSHQRSRNYQSKPQKKKKRSRK